VNETKMKKEQISERKKQKQMKKGIS